MEDRVASWDNYKAIFQVILSSAGPDQVPLDLPNGWLYDMTDEFIYQLQQYCRYRAERRQAKRDSPDEREKIMEIRAHPGIWEPITAIHFMESMVNFADIQHVLDEIREGKMTAADVLSPGNMHVSRALGYFAMVGLLRI